MCIYDAYKEYAHNLCFASPYTTEYDHGEANDPSDCSKSENQFWTIVGKLGFKHRDLKFTPNKNNNKQIAFDLFHMAQFIHFQHKMVLSCYVHCHSA